MNLSLACIALAATVQQPQPGNRPGGQPPGEPPVVKPVPSRTDQPGPWDRDVAVYRASPTGEVTRLATFPRAGVPTLTRLKDGRLIAGNQHFPLGDDKAFDTVAVRFSSDDGATWTEPSVIEVSGMSRNMRFPFDPTLVALPDGRVRLYFTAMYFNAGRPPAVQHIASAISDDGVHFALEEGPRFAIPGRPIIDCAVVLHDGVFHLFAPDNGAHDAIRGNPPAPIPRQGRRDEPPRTGAGYHAISKDGLNFERVDDVRIDESKRWLGTAVSVDGKIIFIGTQDGGPPRPPGERPGKGTPKRSSVWMAESADGKSWKLLDAPSAPGADPGAVKLADGSWLFVTTTEPRPGSPSDQRSKRP